MTPPYLPAGHRKTANPLRADLTNRPFFFQFFSRAKNTLKKRIVKNLRFSLLFAILARPGVDF